MRTAYLGTSEFAATVLRRLAESRHAPALVLTPADRPQGRGRRLASPPAARTATELGLELHKTASVNDPGSEQALRSAAPDAVVVCAFGQLIGEPLLSKHLMLNVHPSLIPRWRGAAPIERAIMAGDELTGMTIMKVTAGLDSGPVALQTGLQLGTEDCFEQVSWRLAELGGELAVDALDLLEQGMLEFSDQDEELATYADKISPGERRLDPGRPAAELERAVCALNPHIGTHLELEGGERLGVRRARVVPDAPEVGLIQVVDGNMVLGTALGGLRLETVQPPGKSAMATEDFLRGHPAPVRAV